MQASMVQIRDFFRKVPKFKSVEADPAVDAISLTGVVLCYEYRNQAVEFAHRHWKPILNYIDLARTRFFIYALLKHVVIFFGFGAVLKALPALFPRMFVGVVILDETSVLILAGFVAFDLAWELLDDSIHRIRGPEV